ncbi:monocarboxylate transporter 7 isoform X4 [Ctenopharyngodon idella]|uniref:monocarboxylate transporter 7 isoform X4 n=1 Tax=Ctenopharyngodon idella TaxID=7959 RepID=UPI00223263F6|nr:monocarboxylate transporter 7 isoform X4 [Ctenopharyngodon idella]
MSVQERGSQVKMAQWIFRLKGCLSSKVYSEVPDGGWGWIVAVAFFLVEMFTYGVIKSFGIFLKDLMSDFEESNSRVSWIISICVFVMTFTAPLSSVLSNRFGFQPVVMFGGFLISLGTISTAFTSSINQMYLSIGIVTGLGYCLTFLPTVTILSQYFSRRRSVVTAMASTGESFAIFAFAPETEQKITYSLPEEQLQGSVSSGDSGVQSLDELERGLKSRKEQEEAEPLQILPKQQDTMSKNKLLDLTVLKEGSFLCYSAFGLFATLGFFAPQLYVVELSASLGTERDKAAYMLSTMAIAEIFGRLSIGWVLNWGHIRKIFVLLVCVSLMCLVLVLFTVVNGFWGLAVCCVLYGFLLGNIASTHIPMLAEDDVIGIQRMPLAVGVYVCIQSFAGLAGPPLGGVLVDITQKYSAAFYSCAVGMGLGAVFLGLVRPAKTGHLCTRRNSGRNKPIVEQVAKDKDRPEEFLELDNQDITS